MYRVIIQVQGESTWSRNSLTFETLDEAMEYAEDLAERWTAVVDYDIVEVEHA